MAEYIDNRIVLHGEEADWFIENALQPDRDVLRQRDENFSRIDALGIVEENGVYSLEIPNIILEDYFSIWKISQLKLNKTFSKWQKKKTVESS